MVNIVLYAVVIAAFMVVAFSMWRAGYGAGRAYAVKAYEPYLREMQKREKTLECIAEHGALATRRSTRVEQIWRRIQDAKARMKNGGSRADEGMVVLEGFAELDQLLGLALASPSQPESGVRTKDGGASTRKEAACG